MAAVFAAVLCLSASAPAAATTDALDQSQVLIISQQSSLKVLAQTFTAGATGGLDRVSLAADTTFANISVTIQTVSANGAPSGTVLGTSNFSGALSCCRQFHDFFFNPTVAVASGTHYAIVVRVLVGAFTWYTSSVIDAYGGGQLYISCNGCAWFTGAQWGQDFAFKSWVTTVAANHPPVVAVDNAAVSVAEGSAPANTGTFSDVDGDTVALSASSGAVTRTGTSSGTWSWTAPATDEASSQTVTITADDGQGHTATATFGVAVTVVAPTVRILTDPPTIPEGTPEPFTGSAVSPATVDNPTLSYEWHVTKNGSAFASGSGASFTFTPDDEGTFVVTFTATDDGGMTGTDSQTMIGTNVAPKDAITGVTQSAPLVIAAQETLTFAGNFSDAGALDSHIVTWNFGDGTTSTANYGPGGSAAFSATHAYAAAGAYTVNLTVTDDDGGVAAATTRVTVLSTAQALNAIAAFVQNLPSLNAGQKNSLTAKLNAAAASASRGDIKACNNQLNAFLNELQAYVNTGKISAADATTLRGAVHAVKGSIGTYNRFLEWWPLGF